MAEPIQDLVKRSVAKYKEGDYESIFGKPYMQYVKSTPVNDVVEEILGKPQYVKPLEIAFKDHPPLDDEIYILALDESSVTTDRRLFLIDGDKLFRPPIPLAEIVSYEEKGFWRKREVIDLASGERIDRKTDATVDADVMRVLIDRATVADSKGRQIEMLAALVLPVQRLLFARAVRRAEQLLASHPEHESLRWILQCVARERSFVEQQLGLLPPDAETPEVPEFNPLQMVMPGDPRVPLLIPTARLCQVILQFTSEDDPGEPEGGPSKARAKELLDSLYEVMQACDALDDTKTEASLAAIWVDQAEAAIMGEAEAWTDQTTFARDPLGSLWPGEPADVTDAGSTLAEKCLERLQQHRQHMLDVEHPDRDFIRASFADAYVLEMAQVAAGKMQQTLQDGRSHSFLFTTEKMAVAILTLRGSIDEAKSWFRDEHGGYIAMLDRYLSNPEIAKTESEVLCHITFGYADEEIWLNLSLMPLNSERFRSVPIVAIDLLSDEERDR